jgi:hypothetical protein
MAETEVGLILVILNICHSSFILLAKILKLNAKTVPEVLWVIWDFLGMFD